MSNPLPPSKDWQKKLASPFVRDTLFAILGGSPPTFNQIRRPPEYPNNAVARTRNDTISFFGPDANDYVLTHELGHIVDDRNIAPVEAALVTAKKPPRGSYASWAEREHVAEAFARAMASARRAFVDSTEAEKDMPGAIEMIHWLQTRPPFKAEN